MCVKYIRISKQQQPKRVPNNLLNYLNKKSLQLTLSLVAFLDIKLFTEDESDLTLIKWYISNLYS